MIIVHITKDNYIYFESDPDTGQTFESERVTLENLDKRDLSLRLSVALNQILGLPLE